MKGYESYFIQPQRLCGAYTPAYPPAPQELPYPGGCLAFSLAQMHMHFARERSKEAKYNLNPSMQALEESIFVHLL